MIEDKEGAGYNAGSFHFNDKFIFGLHNLKQTIQGLIRKKREKMKEEDPPDLIEDSIEKGLAHIRENPDTVFTFEARPRQAGLLIQIFKREASPSFTISRPLNEAAEAFNKVVDPESSHSGASYQMVMKGVLERASRYHYNIERSPGGEVVRFSRNFKL